MITFSIPCGPFWFVSGILATLIVIIVWALIAGARKKKVVKPNTEQGE